MQEALATQALAKGDRDVRVLFLDTAGYTGGRSIARAVSPVPSVHLRREADLLALRISGQQVHRMAPELGNIGQSLGGKTAVEKRAGPVQVFEIEGVIDRVLHHNTRHAITEDRSSTTPHG